MSSNSNNNSKANSTTTETTPVKEKEAVASKAKGTAVKTSIRRKSTDRPVEEEEGKEHDINNDSEEEGSIIVVPNQSWSVKKSDYKIMYPECTDALFEDMSNTINELKGLEDLSEISI
jgi:hypothetical protein